MLKRLEHRLRELRPAEFRRMESKAAKVTADLLDEFHDTFEGMMRATDGLMIHPDHTNAIWRRQLYRLAHDLRGLGGTFNYGLVTAVCESLCSLINNCDLPDDRRLQRHITAHVAALRAVLQFDLKGNGGSQGEDLLTTLGIEKTKP